MQTLTIYRGLPGSGKSTLAWGMNHINLIKGKPSAWFEADMYFINSSGEYEYRKEDIAKAHRWCQDQIRLSMKAEIDHVIVSNTGCERWEIEPYLEMAKQYNYKIQIITCQAEFGSIHNVPTESLNRMKTRFENDLCLK